MPILKDSSYNAPRFFQNGHVQTIYPYFFRSVGEIEYKRERLELPDGDFLDMDFSSVGSKKLVILSHGLEGDTNSQYVKGMARKLNQYDYDVMAWNMRGCSKEINRLKMFYHAGATYDLASVVDHVVSTGKYESISLIGFSLGANLTGKYLGENGKNLHSSIDKAILFSVPADLSCSNRQLHKTLNMGYMDMFLKTMKQKIILKNQINPIDHIVDVKNVHRVKTLEEFTNNYTAPLHGFRDSNDYYSQCSSKQFLSQIEVPTLIINAKNDPIIGKNCYPIKECSKNKNLFLEIPDSGGHVGFVNFDGDHYWSEMRARKFLQECA
ncbi:MAG: alpha/beta fold hydrolase [Bacteriovoracaceae bacterium]|nr:alpha/beta fold hydrolase [Bacteriovoracaceae bacterium]